ncbi:MAG: hypothetical protein ACE366_06120 [Bradymonadia bacterium]
MGNIKDWMVVALAAGALTLTAGCDDDSTSDDGAGGAGAAAGAGAAGGGAAGAGGGVGGAGGGAAGAGGGAAGAGGMAGGGGMGGEGGMAGMPGGAGGEGGMGGDPGPVDKCEDGAGDMTALGAINEFGPSSRLVGLAIPESAEAATEANCGLVGPSNGSGLSALLDLVGGEGLDEFVQPDENGDISLLIFSQFAGMAEGDTIPGTDTADINLYVGVQAEDGFRYAKSSFVDSDPANGPLISFDGANICDNGYLEAGPSVFTVDLPLVEGLPLAISLEQAALRGFTAVNGSGLDFNDGVIAGYLTRDTLLALVNGIITACAADEPPSLCDTVGPLLGNDPEAGLDLLLSFIGDFEAAVEGNGNVRDCDAGVPDDCNAIGVCLQVEMAAETVVGIED